MPKYSIGFNHEIKPQANMKRRNAIKEHPDIPKAQAKLELLEEQLADTTEQDREDELNSINGRIEATYKIIEEERKLKKATRDEMLDVITNSMIVGTIKDESKLDMDELKKKLLELEAQRIQPPPLTRQKAIAMDKVHPDPSRVLVKPPEIKISKKPAGSTLKKDPKASLLAKPKQVGWRA